ncbi:ImuA family protein [Paroceanicella profunda]|uniref:ImuA family protein n=1 Tax=Paroceanicella profunda TaxID=2579971 RepID=UPI002411574A|nr:hypothetical protein [Paroceanicella profunda]
MDLDELRGMIARMEGRAGRLEPGEAAGEAGPPGWTLGAPGPDAALGPPGLETGALHDFTPRAAAHAPGVAAFALRLLVRLPRPGPLLWCQTDFALREYGAPGIAAFRGAGLAPERVVFVSLRKPAEMSFVLEEALGVPALAAVVGEGPPLSFTATRRLALRAEESGVPCLFLGLGAEQGPSVAATRWRLGPAPGLPHPDDPAAPGQPGWSVALERARAGRPGSWKVTWNETTHSFAPLPVPAGGARVPGRGGPEPEPAGLAGGDRSRQA